MSSRIEVPLDATPRYTNLGFAVHPCCPPDHRDCPSPGKIPYNIITEQHMAGWQAHSIVSPAEWEIWKNEPKYRVCNIGCLTGSPSGIIAIDIDSEESKKLACEVACCNVEHLSTWQYKTGKGRRILYRHAGRSKSLNLERDGVTLEILADGKQTVLPPSLHPNGNYYEWIEGFAPKDLAISPAPDWLLDLAPTSSQTIPGEWQKVIEAEVPSGNRNNFLTKLAGHLLAPTSIPPGEALLLLKLVNEKKCQPPLPEREVKQIVESINRREAGTRVSGEDLKNIREKLGLPDEAEVRWK